MTDGSTTTDGQQMTAGRQNGKAKRGKKANARTAQTAHGGKKYGKRRANESAGQLATAAAAQKKNGWSGLAWQAARRSDSSAGAAAWRTANDGKTA